MANFNLNKVILGGRVTADPEFKATPQGISVCSFSVAVNRRSKDGQAPADFINCQAWRATAEFIHRYFKKGSSICLVGSIQTRTWNDQQGNKRYATEVIVDEAYFVDSKSDNAAPAFGMDAASFQTQQAPKFEEIAGDDDLPF
jgi:single-strand DNA-binding protein